MKKWVRMNENGNTWLYFIWLPVSENMLVWHGQKIQIFKSWSVTHVQMCNAWFLKPLEEKVDNGNSFMCNYSCASCCNSATVRGLAAFPFSSYINTDLSTELIFRKEHLPIFWKHFNQSISNIIPFQVKSALLEELLNDRENIGHLVRTAKFLATSVWDTLDKWYKLTWSEFPFLWSRGFELG